MNREVTDIETYANELVEKVIFIRDFYDLSREDRDVLADVCNLIDHNRKELKQI